MEEAKFRFTIIGLGTEAVAIALFQVYDKPPTWILWTIMAVGFVLIVYGLSSFPFTGLRRLLIYYPFWEPKVSVTREQGITLAARLRWHDDVGRPLVAADEKSGLVRNVWAALDIEVRNHTQSKQRITELYLEVRHAVPWKFRRLIAEADPVAIDRDIHWYEKQFPRRVEWELASKCSSLLPRSVRPRVDARRRCSSRSQDLLGFHCR